jgi:hypothetical protein
MKTSWYASQTKIWISPPQVSYSTVGWRDHRAFGAQVANLGEAKLDTAAR